MENEAWEVSKDILSIPPEGTAAYVFEVRVQDTGFGIYGIFEK